MQQQQRALDEAIREAVCQKNASWAREAGLDLEDFDRKLTAVMEQCTKEAIAVSFLEFDSKDFPLLDRIETVQVVIRRQLEIHR